MKKVLSKQIFIQFIINSKKKGLVYMGKKRYLFCFFLFILLFILTIVGQAREQRVMLDFLSPSGNGQIDFSDIPGEIYTYDRVFRNPFLDYRSPEGEDPLLLLEDIDEEVTFILRGVVSFNQQQVALIEQKQGTRIVRPGEWLDNFRISRVEKDRIEFVFEYSEGQRVFHMEIGGDIVEVY